MKATPLVAMWRRIRPRRQAESTARTENPARQSAELHVADTLNGGAIKPGAAAASAMTLDAWILAPATDRDIEDVLNKSTCINNRMTVNCS